MAKYQLNRSDGPWQYPTLGFIAAANAILDGTLFTPAITSPPDAYWSVYTGANAQTGITPFTYPYAAGSPTPVTSDGYVLTYDATVGGGVYKIRSPFAGNVKDYGAVGDGTADDTAAIQSAFTALPASGGAVYLPAGTYKVSSEITVSKPCVILGAGYATNIKTNSATANIFTLSAQFVVMRDLNMTTSVTRTGGWYVDILPIASRFRIENFFMDGAYGGIRTAANAACTIDKGSILSCTSGTGIAVRVDAGVDVSINDLTVDAAAQIYSGVYITNTGDVTITNSSLIHAGNALQVECGVGQSVASVWAANSFFDNSGTGVRLSASGGTITRSRFTGCWMSSSTAWGINLSSSAGGGIDGTDILGCHVFLNGGGGITLNDAGVVNTRIADSAICQNAGNPGILLNASLTSVSIIGNKIGNGYGLAGNGWGIYFANTTQNKLQVSNNDLTGNTNTAIAGPPTAGSDIIISDNLGINAGYTGAVTVTASPFTHTAGPTYETVYINAGTVSLVQVDGASVFQSSNVAVRLGPRKSVVITYSVAPGVSVTSD